MINFPYCEELYTQTGGFGVGFYPLFGVIGKDNVVYYNEAGLSQANISEKLKEAIQSFYDLQLDPIEDLTIVKGSTITIDLSNYYYTNSGAEISYELEFISNPDALSGELAGSILTLTANEVADAVRVKVKGISGEEVVVAQFDVTITSTEFIEEEAGIVNGSVKLFQNYPNPFNPSTTISFSINEDARVRLTIFDTEGKKLRELLDKNLKAGQHNVKFNANRLNSGVYYYRLEAGRVSLIKKLILTK